MSRHNSSRPMYRAQHFGCRACRIVCNVTSRLDTARHVRRCRARRGERVKPCYSTSLPQPKCTGSTHKTCSVVSRRDKPSGI